MSNVYLSETADPILIAYLKALGHRVAVVNKTEYTYDPVSSHPDIYMCGLGPGRPVFFGDPQKLGSDYPLNCIYNAACTGSYFIHNLKYTAPSLMAQTSALEKIHVSQGYAKCNIVIVDENSIITADRGIHKACREKLDVLLIEPGYIRLPGFSYGFLGGASGRIGEEIVFNGNLEEHPDYKRIASFIKERKLKLTYFKEYGLMDIGSILENPRTFSAL